MNHPINKLSSKYPSQETLAKMYGCTKYQLADKMRNSFHIDDKFLPALSKYRVSHFSGKFFGLMVTDGQVTFGWEEDNPVTYAVIYHNCNPFAAKRAKEVRLSFRAAQPEFNLEPIVLVEIVQEGEIA